MPLLDCTTLVEDCILENVAREDILNWESVKDVVMWVMGAETSKEDAVAKLNEGPCVEIRAFGQVFIGLRNQLDVNYKPDQIP